MTHNHEYETVEAALAAVDLAEQDCAADMGDDAVDECYADLV